MVRPVCVWVGGCMQMCGCGGGRMCARAGGCACGWVCTRGCMWAGGCVCRACGQVGVGACAVHVGRWVWVRVCMRAVEFQQIQDDTCLDMV